ncbi:glycosyltransferase [Algoriphagus sp. NG3]|uniref:glycosyltransferase n=1 Tax=Algoriphagus sp. NG3 TaxID=3097546 RepID=UPI002A81DEAC|nr:glycosyltransferase [Algoriphagus sp. NG3]WPR77402.1 glycosyltransferase [Algoriphagus sp. NG3]
MVEKRRVLIVTAIYTMPDYPAKGLFVKEQILALAETGEFIFDVLYVDIRSCKLTSLISNFVNRFLFKKRNFKILERSEDLSVYHLFIPNNRRVPDFLQLLIEKYNVRKFINLYQKDDKDPVLIHALNGNPSGLLANVVVDILKKPVVMTEHNPILFHHLSRSRGKQIIQSYVNSREVAALSKFQNLSLLNCDFKIKTVLIPNLINEELFYIDYNVKKPSVFTIISVLYFKPIKGYETLVQALSILKNRGVEFRFILIGEGIEYLISLCRNFNVYEWGEYFYNIKHSDLCQFFNRSHLYVCSSIVETHGMAPREAMLCGLPVVSTDNGGVEDSIFDLTGLISNNGDAADLASKIEKVKKRYLNYNGDEIRQSVIEDCGKKVFVDNMKNFYRID